MLMKKLYSLLLLGGLLFFGVQCVSATDIRSGGNLYVRNLNNAGITGLWKLSTAYMRVYVFGESGSMWLNPTNNSPVVGIDGEEGAVYEYVIPSGTWSNIIITRGATSTYEFDGDKWNQTGDIPLPSDGNLIYSYKNSDATNEWLNYDERAIATNWYLYSTSGEWSTIQLIKATADATTASATVSVTSLNASLEFYIQSAASGVTLKNNGTMTPVSNGPWTFKTSDNNAHFKSTVAGNYTFTFNLNTNEITLTYPTEYSRADITEANIWGTICLPVNGEISNATLYTILGKYDGKLYLSSAGTALTAGMPYLFKSSASSPSVELANTAYEETPLSEGGTDTEGLHGRFVDQPFSGFDDVSSIYVVRDHEIQRASKGSGILANRAFIQLAEVGDLSNVPSAPAMHFDINEESNATDVQSIGAEEVAVKIIENGQLLIKKNGIVYDTTGRVVR